jgi:hypothetical protein
VCKDLRRAHAPALSVVHTAGAAAKAIVGPSRTPESQGRLRPVRREAAQGTLSQSSYRPTDLALLVEGGRPETMRT